MTVTTITDAELTPKDYASDQEVRWCPGCGDYAILKAVQKALAELGARRERTVFVSGIGCAARFPYYLSTYGFHTIHGRAPAIATGIKLANPELDVWVITGDAAPDARIHVEHGRPLMFGRNGDRGLRLKPGTLALEVVEVGDGGARPQDILVHDETNRALAQLLVALEPPEFPVALGVLYCNPAPSYDAEVYAQARAAGFGR